MKVKGDNLLVIAWSQRPIMRAKALLPTDYLKGDVLSDLLTEKGVQSQLIGRLVCDDKCCCRRTAWGEGVADFLKHMVSRANYILRAIAARLVVVHSIYSLRS